MPHSEFQTTASDGLSLFGRVWKPEGESSSVLCLVHGLGIHSGLYHRFAATLNEAGIAVVALDIRGFGKSGGKRGHTPSYDILMNDISLLITTAQERFSQLPLFLFGLSLGGNLVINYALRRKPQIAGVISFCPALKLAFDPPAWKMVLARIFNHIAPSITMDNEIDVNDVTRNKEMVEEIKKDPLVHTRISPALFSGFYNAGFWALDHAAELSLPMLLMHGDADKLTSYKASQEFSDKAGALCTCRIWPGFYHEIHNDPGRDAVMAELIEWLQSRMGSR